MRRLLTTSSLGLAVPLLVTAAVISRPAPVQAATRSSSPSQRVIALEARLAELGYLPPRAVSGKMNERTHQAIMAFQGWEGLQRDGDAGPVTRARLATATRPRPLPGTGQRVEIHLRKQVALLVRGDWVVRALHVSTGRPGLSTPTGRFRVFRKERESWSVPYRVWLPWASYFDGGIAMHGYAELTPFPASHGCVRVPLSEAPQVYEFARLGTPVRVVP